MTIAGWIEHCARRLDEAGVAFGHGTDNAGDEAAWLVLATLGLPLDGRGVDPGRGVDDGEAEAIGRLLAERIGSRRPLAYLLGEAWFAGLPFRVTPDVLVPRSPIAEMIAERYAPWIRPGRIRRVLDLCTGSGCIAIATALALPMATVDASDISPAALAVARDNVARHRLTDRVRLFEADGFTGLGGRRYDLIVTNPPYVAGDRLARLPAEFRAEPGLALVSGHDGLDLPLAILAGAADHLEPGGVLVCEVGEGAGRLVDLLPGAPFTWPDFAAGGDGVFVIGQAELVTLGVRAQALLEQRTHVA